jgi:hypothetical protein
MSTSPIDPEKIVESLLRQVAAQAQQIAMLQAIVEQAVATGEPEVVEAPTE